MRIVVIGMGSIGQRHYRNLKALGYSHVQGWDIDPAKGSPIDWSWKPEVALICTPPDSHTQLAINAVHAGVKGLFVEKPLSDRLGAAENTLMRLAEEAGVVTMVGCNWRFRAGVKALRLADSQQARFEARMPPPPRHLRHGVILETAIHLIDLATWSLGPANVDRREVKRLKGGTDFEVEALLFHDNGARSLVFASWRWPFYDVDFTADDRHRSWYDFRRVNAMYLSELRHFMRCVKTGDATGNDFRFAAETLRIALGVRECN